MREPKISRRRASVSLDNITTAIMHLIHVEAVVILGIVIPQMSSLIVSAAPSDCLAAVDTCMSDLCRSEQASYSAMCNNEGCQIKGSTVCNMTIQNLLDQFPSLRGCLCAWEEELCDSIQELATQCRRKPANQLKRSTIIDWESSTLIGYEYDGAGSCSDQMRLCVSDAICNKNMVSILQVCTADLCNQDHCQQVTGHFYGSMPQNVAEMLVMCECEASDQSCLEMKTALHSGTCGDSTLSCLDTVKQCLRDRNCRDLLQGFQAKCWSYVDAECSVSDLGSDECLTNMDPALISGADSECKKAFIATLGTVLHHPCSCKGVYDDELHTCNMIYNILHNRTIFMASWKSSRGSSILPGRTDSENSRTWSHDHLLYVFAIVLLVGVVVLMPLVIVSKIWTLRKRDRTKFHHPNKCVIIF